MWAGALKKVHCWANGCLGGKMGVIRGIVERLEMVGREEQYLYVFSGEIRGNYFSS